MNEHSSLRTLLRKKIRTCECSLATKTLPILLLIGLALKTEDFQILCNRG